VSDHRLAHNIELARRRAQLSREQLADEIGRKPSVVGSYERGTVEPPLSVLRAIADATGTTLLDLLGVQVSPRDLLEVLLEYGAELSPVAHPDTGYPIPGIIIGVEINDGRDAE